MVQQWRQSASVLLSLAGVQDFSVMAHQPATPEARVGVRLGGTLFYLRDEESATRLAQGWRRLANDGARLPRQVDTAALAPMNGVTDAAVMVEVQGRPSMSCRMERHPGRPSFLRVSMGRVVMDVWDLGAYSSVVRAFGDAAELAQTAFQPLSGPMTQRAAAQRATARASEVFPAPRVRRHVASRPAAAPRAAVPVAPKLGRSR